MRRIFSINNSRSRNAILVALILSYLLIELFQISLGGLFFDDAIDGTLTIAILKNDTCGQGFRIFNQDLPLMLNRIHAAMASYFILPFFYFLGISAKSLRLLTISFGALTLLFTYLFTEMFFNYKTALITVLLLALNFTFILQTRLGLMNGSMLLALIMCSLFCFFKWYLKKKSLYLYLAAFLLGVGLSIRIWFSWYIVSLCLCGLIFKTNLKLRFKEKDNFYFEIFFSLLFFILGGFLLFYYNLTNNFASIRFFLKNFSFTEEAGVNNFAYLGNLSVRFKHIFELVANKDWGFNFSNLFLAFYLFPIGWVFYILLSKRKSLLPKKRILFLVILTLSILLQSPFTPSNLRCLHIFLLFPLLILLVSIGIIEFNFYFKRKLIVALVVLFFLSTEIYKNFSGYRYFRETGGEAYNSDAINVLAQWVLKEKEYNKIIILSGKIYDSLGVLTGGALYGKIIDLTYGCYCYESKTGMSYEERERFQPDFENLIKETKNIYIEVVPFGAKYWSCDRIAADIMKKNKMEILEKEKFCQKKDNTVFYRAFTIK